MVTFLVFVFTKKKNIFYTVFKTDINQEALLHPYINIRKKPSQIPSSFLIST